MICEMNGVAGCGKTTLVNELCDYMSKKDVTIIRACVTDFNGHGLSWFARGYNKIKNLLAMISPECISLTILLIKRVYIARVKGKHVESYYEILINIAYMCFLKKKFKSNLGKFVISDEGVIQALVAFIVSTKYYICLQEFVESVFQYFPENIFRIDCNINVEDALLRIEKRNRTKAAIDFFNGEKLNLFLKTFIDKMQMIRNMSDFYGHKSVTISAMTDLKFNCEFVLDEILKVSDEGWEW